jgi:hypothetical protein
VARSGARERNLVTDLTDLNDRPEEEVGQPKSLSPQGFSPY